MKSKLVIWTFSLCTDIKTHFSKIPGTLAHFYDCSLISLAQTIIRLRQQGGDWWGKAKRTIVCSIRIWWHSMIVDYLNLIWILIEKDRSHPHSCKAIKLRGFSCLKYWGSNGNSTHYFLTHQSLLQATKGQTLGLLLHNYSLRDSVSCFWAHRSWCVVFWQILLSRLSILHSDWSVQN